MGKIPNFTDSERMKTPKTDCALNIYKDKEFYQLGFQVCWPWKRRVPCHLNHRRLEHVCMSGQANDVFPVTWLNEWRLLTPSAPRDRSSHVHVRVMSMATNPCRLCQTTLTSKNSVSLFSIAGLQHKWPERITDLLGVQVVSGDGLPQHVCQKCKRR